MRQEALPARVSFAFPPGKGRGWCFVCFSTPYVQTSSTTHSWRTERLDTSWLSSTEKCSSLASIAKAGLALCSMVLACTGLPRAELEPQPPRNTCRPPPLRADRPA